MFNSPQSNTEFHRVLLKFNVIQSGTECSEGSRKHKAMKTLVDVHEILPPYGRLNDKMG